MSLKVFNKNTNLRVLLLLLCMCGGVIPKNPYKSGEVRADIPKGCAYLRCKRGDQCVNRKFWCRNSPCPSMLYCSKSRKESLKGPSSCDMVRCSKGFICLVRVRHCRWGEPCEQQIARCVSERDYYDGPASCIDFKCPSGLRCILRESLCAKPPCKLVKSCANIKDVNRWYGECRSLGCLSEHECFLRRPTSDCNGYPCKHTPDCAAKSEEELEANEQCRGWVCPSGEECSTHTDGACKRGNCRISRSCHRPLMIPLNVTPTPKHSWRDDVKLSFYSRLDRNISKPGMNHLSYGKSRNNKVPRDGVARDKKKPTNLAIGKFHKNLFHESPINVSPNSKSASSRSSSASPDITSGRGAQPTVTSLSTWLNHLKQKTGVDAIEAWIKKAEKQENYGAFLEWLESVKDMLGPAAYDLWIEEVRTMTVTSLAFQKWLPPVHTNSSSVTSHVVEPVRNIADVNAQGLGVSTDSRKSIKYRDNEDENDDSKQRRLNSEIQDTGAIKIDDFKEESYIFPPRNDTKFIQTEVTDKSRIQTPFEIPTLPPSLRMKEWQQFYTPDPRTVQQTYPLQQNVQNFVPWTNQDSAFRGFENADPMNSWYQQFQQNPRINSHFLNPNTWKGQLPPAGSPGYDQGSMDRRFLDAPKIADQRFQTNWSSWQPPNGDLNFLRPNSWGDQTIVPVSRQRDQTFMDRRFFEPGEISFQQSPDARSHFSRPNNRQKFLETAKWPESEYQTNLSDTNWQQFPAPDVNFLQPNVWQEKLFSPPNLEWQQQRNHRDQFDRKFLQSIKLPGEIFPQVNEEPIEVYPDNSTNGDTSWIQYFLDQASQQLVPPENVGTFPSDAEQFGYESWPGSNYRGRSLADVPHRRTKHEDSTHNVGHLRYDGGDTGKSDETSHDLLEDPGVLFPGFPWLMDPRLQDFYLRLRDQDRRHFYDKSHRESFPPLSGLSRGQRVVDADVRSLWQNAIFEESQRASPGLKYYWPDPYGHNRLYKIAAPRPPLSSAVRHRPIGVRELDPRVDPFPKPNRPEPDRDRKQGFAFSDTDFDTPGQPMGVADLWNPKFRTPLSSAVHKPDRESWSRRDIVEKKSPLTTTISPPTVPSSRNTAAQQVMTIPSEDSHGVKDSDHQGGIKNIESYEEDDGVFPLLLSLQGYIETSKEDEPKNPAMPSKDLTILPVYTVQDASDTEKEYGDDYESPPDGTPNLPSNSDDEAPDFFENGKYVEPPFFPNNLKRVFDAEAAMIIKNTTGESDVEIKDIKWEYSDDDEDTLLGDQLSFFIPSQDSYTPSDGLSSVEEGRDWVRSPSRSRKDDDVENDYYDGGSDYDDEAISGHRSNYNFQQVNIGESLNREQAPEDFIDSFHNDPDHKRFKKNRP